jgi:hypothetical protein
MWRFEDYITELQELQSVPDSISWCLSPTGLIIQGELSNLETTGGKPVTAGRVWNNFKEGIIHHAETYGVPVELIIATICTESGGNPKATRKEPGYISPRRTPNKISIGLMQTLLSTARSTLSRDDIDLEWLYVPENSIEAGTAYIAFQANHTHFDPPKVACAYNAGGIYHNSSQSNRWRMRQFPIGTSEHADRFVKWFNDCFLLFSDMNISDVPDCSFFKVLNG